MAEIQKQQENTMFSEETENHQENASFPEENEEENKKFNSTISSNEAFLGELNLVLILSYLSCSEEIVDLKEVKETEYIKEQIAKHSSSSPRKKARETSDFRAVGRLQTSRFQQKMVDCRHSRRM
ncbi:hypothetical protein LIER_42060 [Lithospermum erythrorhizon]|uniref:Uncharacterized protein n=1 Tax=Lithospermum erythrorhizon TaxID=34254 RepID=A0AAV3RIS4_LITER